jgi:hypothetical protein
MIDVQVRDDRYVITLPKTVLVLTKAEFIRALRRGKWWRRREALKARQGQHEASPPTPLPSGRRPSKRYGNHSPGNGPLWCNSSFSCGI